MLSLNDKQASAVAHDGSLLVTACPGSGKTRVLTARVIRGLEELNSTKQRVAALTFTNRASDEIRVRLDRLDIPQSQLWAGTIHSFALEWVLRPYASYLAELRRGFTVADEYVTAALLHELKAEYGKGPYFEVATSRSRNGSTSNTDGDAREIYEAYRRRLSELKLIDYDDVLFLAYRLLSLNGEVAATLASVFRLFCIDEIQDTQDLQWAILGCIARHAEQAPDFFLVGDEDQCIYESLGALLPSAEEICAEFGLDKLTTLELSGNYRSTQRIIDFCRLLRPDACQMQSLAPNADELGQITFQDRSVDVEDLPVAVAALVQDSLDSGIEMRDICILAPQWGHVRAIGRSLVNLLPDVEFDAPGLSPIHAQRENLWFRVARLLLTQPSPPMYRTRMRWSAELQRELEQVYCVSVPPEFGSPRSMLRLLNGLDSREPGGLAYLRDCFTQFLDYLGVDGEEDSPLRRGLDSFFAKADSTMERIGDAAIDDVTSFRKLFRHPSGVVISTCHGVKGEEYQTVIAFGLLKGFVPHWNEIFQLDEDAWRNRASRLLFVVASRAKTRLHLIAESGRRTARGVEYETSPPLAAVEFDFDPVP